MDNKKIVITGASRGIGLEMARILIGKGHTVFGAVRNPDAQGAGGGRRALRRVRAPLGRCLVLLR